MELNERAARAMGWERCANGKNTYCYHDERGLLHIVEANFDTDISQAWMLVEKVIEKGYFVELNHKYDYWFCILQPKRGVAKVGEASTAAEAITAACVEALENENSR